MRQIRPWRVDDFIAMFSWAFLANVAFVLLGTTTFFSLILATANSLQFQGIKKEKKLGRPIQPDRDRRLFFCFFLCFFWTDLTYEKIMPPRSARKKERKKKTSL